MKFIPNTTSTKLEKGRDGWRAESWKLIGGDRYLQISTRKTNSCLRSTAYGVTVTDAGFMMELFSDFKEDLGHSIERCTEKTIAKLHLIAMGRADSALHSAIDFYAAKDAAKSLKALSAVLCD